MKTTVQSKKRVSAQRKILTPLGIIGSFLSLTEIVAGIAATKTTGAIQTMLVIFVCIFPMAVAGAFFIILWSRPHVFYPPAEFGSQQDVRAYVEAMQAKRERTDVSLVRIISSEQEGVQAPKSDTEKQKTIAEPEARDAEKKGAEGEVSKTADDIAMDMAMAFIEHRIEEAEQSFAKLMDVEQDPTKRRANEVWHAYLQYTYAERTSGFDELIRFAKAPETQSQASFFLGLSYQRLKEFDKAVEAFKKSAETAPSEMKPNRLVSLAEAYASSGSPELGITTLIDALRECAQDQRFILYEGLASAFEKSGDQEMRALALELAVDNRPQDTDLRFKAAWSYSKSGLNDLAFLHYTAELAAESDAVAALNNLGVLCENFDLPISAVDNYRQAFKNKHSLAGANLAYQFLEAGFSSEAKKILDEAKEMKNPHQNVASALATLAQRQDGEQEAKTKILEYAQREQKFMKDYANLYFTRASDHFSGQWRTADGEKLSIVKQDSRITAGWSHAKRKKELSGFVTNRTAKIRVKSSLEGTLLFTDPKDFSVYAFTADVNHMSWLWFDSGAPTFVSFERVTDS